MRRSGRQNKPFKFFDDSPTYIQPTKPKKPQVQAPIPPETRPAEDPPAPEIKQLQDQQLPPFTPSIQVAETSFQVLWTERDPYDLFIKLLGWESILAIVAATNAYANGRMGPQPRHAREWTNLNTSEFLCWLGLLFTMGIQAQRRRKEHWPAFAVFMSKYRWDQIHRYLTFNIATTTQPPPLPSPTNQYWSKLEPVYSTVRLNCSRAVTPPSWFSVDEIMVAFRGRSIHIVKQKNKPIEEGYKVWGLGFKGYYYDWLSYSPIIGTEGGANKRARHFEARGIPEGVMLADTFTVPVMLCQRLVDRLPHRKWVVFLDNLFLNVPVAHVLLNFFIGVMGTTRKNAAGVPPQLIALKDRNTPMLYGSQVSSQVGKALCFAWQDNNVVLSITTAFTLVKGVDNWILRMRRRPKVSSTNAAIARPIFGDQVRKELVIPAAIDAYNHHMNGIDRANQIRRNFSCHRQFEHRNWRPMAFWLFDVCLSNGYTIWRSFSSPRLKASHREHEIYSKLLIKGLLMRGHHHVPGRLDKRRRCVWGAQHRGECLPKAQTDPFTPTERQERQRQRDTSRTVLGDVTNRQKPPQWRSRHITTGCTICNVYLCIDRACFNNWHMSLIQNLL